MTSPYDNVEVTVEDGVLVIRCNVQDVQPSPSKSGKSMIYATTGGAKVVGGNGESFSLNLNLYRGR